MSQRELAEPGVSYAYLSRIEAGQCAPSLKALRIVARKLGVTVEHLETGSPVSVANARELRVLEAELRLRLDEDPSGAERIFRELVDAARAEGEVTLEVRARAGVGLALARRGELREAVFHLELALSSDSVSPLGRPDVYETLARCYAASGSVDRAVELLDAGLAELERLAPDEGVTAARLAGVRAVVANRNGNHEPLRQSLAEDHPAEQGEALHALASAQAAAGELDEAEASYRRAIEQLASGRRWREAADASRDWASRLRAAGRTEDALEVMDRATMLSIRGMGAEARRGRS